MSDQYDDWGSDYEKPHAANWRNSSHTTAIIGMLMNPSSWNNSTIKDGYSTFTCSHDPDAGSEYEEPIKHTIINLNQFFSEAGLLPKITNIHAPQQLLPHQYLMRDRGRELLIQLPLHQIERFTRNYEKKDSIQALIKDNSDNIPSKEELIRKWSYKPPEQKAANRLLGILYSEDKAPFISRPALAHAIGQIDDTALAGTLRNIDNGSLTIESLIEAYEYDKESLRSQLDPDKPANQEIKSPEEIKATYPAALKKLAAHDGEIPTAKELLAQFKDIPPAMYILAATLRDYASTQNKGRES